MTTKQYKDIIKSLGLSQLAAGRLLGFSPRQAHRIAVGESHVPEPAAKLLRLIVELKIDPNKVK